MNSTEIVVVGSYNRDTVLSVAHLPEPGETCFAAGRRQGHGGKGSNQAVQAALCGARVTILTAVGDDAAGADAFALWTGAGVDTSHAVSLKGEDTGTATVIVNTEGENCIVVDLAANDRLSPTDIDAAAQTIAKSKLVLGQLEAPVSATLRAFEIARDAGVMTLLNAAPAPEAIDPALLALTDVLFVNRIEAMALAGSTQLQSLQTSLLPKVGRSIVMTLGADGAVILDRNLPPLSRPAMRIDVVDTTGAGDAFIGAFAARLAAGHDLASALEWGVSAGAIACSRPGAAASYGDRAEISRLAGTD